MVNFTSSDILNYAECTSRSLYPSNPKLFDTRDSITAYLVSNLLSKFMESAQDHKVLDITKLNKHLNVLWSKIQGRITFPVSPNDYIILQSYAKRLLNHFNLFGKLEVLVVNQLFEYTIGENTIVVPLTVFRSNKTIHVYYVDNDIFTDERPAGYTFLSPIIHRIGKEICKGHTYIMSGVIYRSQTLRTYQCIDNPRVDDSLSNLISGISSKITYPRISPNCKLCKSKETCKWYDTTTPN